MHAGEALCLDSVGARAAGRPIGVFPCHAGGGAQALLLTKEGQLYVMAHSLCLMARGNGDQVRYYNMYI